MLVLRLTIDVDGLGRAGSLVIADPDRSPVAGDWVVVQRPEDYQCERWRGGGQYEATVIRVLF